MFDGFDLNFIVGSASAFSALLAFFTMIFSWFTLRQTLSLKARKRQAEAARHFLEELQTDLLPAENLDSEELQRRLRLFEKVLEEFDRFSIEISVDNKNANEMTDEIQLFRNNMQQKLTKAGRSLAR